MSTRIYLAPAAAGKTAHVLARARGVVRCLAEIGGAATCGAIGVRVLTFDRLYAEVLDAAGEIYVELSDPVQYRLNASRPVEGIGGANRIDAMFGRDLFDGCACGMVEDQNAGVSAPVPCRRDPKIS